MNLDSNSEYDGSTGRERRYREFVALLARHDQTIRRFVRSLMPTSEALDDVIQETALECWKKYDEFAPTAGNDSAEEFVRWACVIARFKVLSHFRDCSRDRLQFRESVIAKLADSSITDLSRDESERQAVRSCLSQLSDDQRRLVLSIHSPGDSVAKIAAETGVNARRLYSRVNALRKRLLDCVQAKVTAETAHG